MIGWKVEESERSSGMTKIWGLINDNYKWISFREKNEILCLDMLSLGCQLDIYDKVLRDFSGGRLGLIPGPGTRSPPCHDERSHVPHLRPSAAK